MWAQVAPTPHAALTSEGLYLAQTPAWAALPAMEQLLLQHMAVHLQPEVGRGASARMDLLWLATPVSMLPGLGVGFRDWNPHKLLPHSSIHPSPPGLCKL